MELMEVILSKDNLNRAYKKVVANKGASGIDEITVEELGSYIRENQEVIINSLRNRTYFPKPVRRVYIPKENGIADVIHQNNRLKEMPAYFSISWHYYIMRKPLLDGIKKI